MGLQRLLSVIGILLLTATPTQLTSQQYHLINRSLTWNEAQVFCRTKFTDLATVDNMGDQNQLVNTLGGQVSHSWIGLWKHGLKTWMWSDGSGRLRFNHWNDGEPNNVAGNEWCAEMSDAGKWNDISCDEAKDFVCYERRNDGMERYVFYPDSQTWLSSQEICRSKHTDMASVKSTMDNVEIVNVAHPSTDHKVWVGLFRDTWTWSDGRETSFRYWLSGASSLGGCASVGVSQQGRWLMGSCSQKHTFVCEGDLKVQKLLIRMKVQSEEDPTGLSDAILKQLETRLHQESVTDFKLTWQKNEAGLIFQHQEPLMVTQAKDERRFLVL